MSQRSRTRWIDRWLGLGPRARLSAGLPGRLGARLRSGRDRGLGFGALVRSWWQVDRIRVSPRQGQLLRITPPCIVRVDEVIAQVVSRSVGSDGAGPYVAYECRTERGPAQLRICPVGPSYRQQVRWIEADRTFELSEDMIEVYG